MLLSLLLACTDPAPVEDSELAPLELSDLVATPHQDFPTLLRVDWSQSREAEVVVQSRVAGEDWVSAPGGTVVGLPYGALVELRLVGEGIESEPISVQLDALPTGFPAPELVVDEGGDPAHPWILGSVCQGEGGWEGGLHWSFILDRKGRVVWARATPGMDWTLYARLSRDGRALLIDEGSFWAHWDNGVASQVHRLRLDGTVEQSWDTVGLQHSYDELPGGSLVYGAARQQDEAIEVVDSDNEREEIWACREGTATEGGWCFSNTVSYSDEREVLLFSIPDASQIAEVTLEGETIALYGKEGYHFEPPESAFKWQHGSVYEQDGYLLVSTHSNGVEETVVRAYEVDHEAQLLREVYSFGEGLGQHGEYGGTVVRSEAGYLLQELGSGAIIREASPSGELVWQVDFPGERQLGRAQYLSELYDLVD